MNVNSGRVLLIEDDAEESALMARYIQGLGYGIETAANGDEGFQRLGVSQPDIVLLNRNLPDIPGLELLRKIKEDSRFAEMPVMLMSSDDSEEAAIIGLSSGAMDYIYKPVRMAELMVKIQNALELVKYRQELHALNSQLKKEKGLLLKYFSEDLVDKILKEEVSTELGGMNQIASILFFDIRGSTGIAENLDPKDFAQFISMIFTDIMDLIFSSNGSVNKLLGDGMLATFGCPITSDDDARNAVNCAIGIRDYMASFNSVRPDYLSAPVEMGIGLSTGKVFAGNIGSWRRMEYTVMGDPVNTAARLQSMTKKLECNILIDETTFARSNGVSAQKVENVAIRGKEKPIPIYKLLGPGT